MFSHRIRLLSVIINISFLFIVVSLFSFQVVRSGHYKGLSLRNTIRMIPIEASRGGIYDRNGEALGVDKISFDLVVIPQEVEDTEATLKDLSKVTGIEQSKLSKSYRRNYRLPFVPVKVATNLDREKAFWLEEKITTIPGALIWTEPRRIYPNKKVAAHILGHVGRIAKGEFARLKDYGYKVKDLVGKTGIEKYYDAYLRGEDGGTQIEVDANSKEVRRLGFQEPRRGKDITLTIDLGLQRFADMLISEKAGSIIVMNVKTGEILALSSAPAFDPNVFVSGSNKARGAVLTNRARPLLNRAITGTYPPGSTFKIVVAVAGIVTGAINKNTSFRCNGKFRLGRWTFRCWKKTGHGPQNVIDALTHSCNVFFYNLGRSLGAEQIHRYATGFGLGSLTGIDLPQEVKAIAPNSLWKRFTIKKPWYDGDTINYSIGQGFLLATPLQMLRAVTIIANEGYSPTPYLVNRIEGKRPFKRKVHSTRFNKAALKIVKDGMLGVVNESTGTGQSAKIKNLKVSGKTGTAQPGTRGATHAWFVGFLPSGNPQVSIVVFLEHGGKGGGDASRFARLLGVYMKENGLLDGSLKKELN